MDCNEYNKHLSSFVDGELPSAAQNEMRSHEDCCESCGENHHAMIALGRQIRGASSSAPTGLRAQILADALAAGRNSAAPRLPWLPIVWRVAALVVGMSSVWLMQSALGSPSDSSVQSTPTLRSLVLESESSLELGGSFEPHFLALRRRPEGRLLNELMGR